MIVSIDPIQDDTTQALLWCINYIGAIFHVCGSRFWGTAGPCSDFDLVTEDQIDPEVLATAGFNQLKMSYVDTNTNDIWQRGKVQVIFIKSWKRRKAAREYLKTHDKDMHKTESWNEYYENFPESDSF